MTEQTGTQAEIKAWWETNPMTYAGRRTNPYLGGTPEWFAEVDRVLFERVSSFFANTKGDKPFSNLIPYRELRGKEVLEVGCGSGAHTRLIIEAGACLTAIDLTEKAVALTQARLALASLTADIVQMDARSLNFADESFDFVWSWGVIHHSEDTEQIVRELARVLRPGGQARVMVYHRRSIEFLMLLTLGALTGRLFRDGVAGTLNHYSDGFIAKFYTQKQLGGLFQPYFKQVQTRVFGQKCELVPLPGNTIIGRLKRGIASSIPESFAARVLSKWGGMLFLTAKK